MTPTLYGGRAPARSLAHAGAKHDCPDCFSYAYHGLPSQTAVQIGKTLHHPHCPRFRKPDSMAARFVAVFAPPPKVATAGLFSADVTAKGGELVQALNDAIGQLDTDITLDACGEWYSTACKGSIPVVDSLESKLASMEASGKTLDAASILDAAGVAASPSNVSAFGKCVKAKEDAGHAVPRGTLAYCAIAVRDAISPGDPLLPKSHSTAAFRDRWQTFQQTFLRFYDKYQTESSSALGNVPSDAEVAAQMKQYNDYRQQFIDNGGSTTAPSLGTPWSISTWAIVLGVAAAVGYVGLKVLIKRLGG